MTKKSKKEKIYHTALRIFAEHGYKKTTIEDIAGAMGLAAGTLYLYAKNKRDLYMASVGWSLNIWQQRVKEAVAEAAHGGPMAKLEALSFTAYRYLAEDVTLRRVLERDPELLPVFESKDPYLEINHESVSMLREILAEGAESGLFEIEDIDDTAKCLFFIYILLVQKTYIGAEGDSVQKMFNITITLIIKGLLGKDALH